MSTDLYGTKETNNTDMRRATPIGINQLTALELAFHESVVTAEAVASDRAIQISAARHTIKVLKRRGFLTNSGRITDSGKAAMNEAHERMLNESVV